MFVYHIKASGKRFVSFTAYSPATSFGRTFFQHSLEIGTSLPLILYFLLQVCQELLLIKKDSSDKVSPYKQLKYNHSDMRSHNWNPLVYSASLSPQFHGCC